MQRKQEKVRLWNLELLIQEAGSAASLARQVGTSESYLSQIRRQLPTPKGTPRGIGDDLAAKLERGMDKPLGWMDEPHFSLDGEFQEPSLQAHDRSDRLAAGIYPRHPLIRWEQAEAWPALAATLDPADAEDWLPCPVKCSRHSFVLRVTGESMAPRFHPGEFIFVDPEVKPERDAFVVVRPPEAPGPLLRQVHAEGGQTYLKALNPDWPERIVAMDRNTRLLGTVVFKGEALS